MAIHNLGQAITDEEFEKYGDLLQIMRDVLYLDSKHIPLAIQHNNSRADYWFKLHNKLLKVAQEEFEQL